MAQSVSLLLSAQHGADLEGVIGDRGRPVKHVQRAQIILLSAERLPVLEIANRIGISRPMVWRELCRKIGDGVNQAADLISATASIPSLNFIPFTTFGNWF